MAIIEERAQIRKMEDTHNIVMENRSKLNISGVNEVDSFDEKTIVLYTVQGMLTICGEDMHISKLNVENGDVAVEGEIWSLEYSDKDVKKVRGFLSRIFK
jgi:sporulation protein YabP